MARLELTTCQERALAEILTARETCATHLLTGYAGTGKTTLMQRVARALRKQGRRSSLPPRPTRQLPC